MFLNYGFDKLYFWKGFTVIPDVGINNFFHNVKFHVLQSSGEWLRIFRYSEDITLKTSHGRHPATRQRCPWKLGPSYVEHAGKHLRCSVILVKLPDKCTRISLHAFALSTSSSTESPGEEILRSTDFEVHCLKIGRNRVHGKFPHQVTGRKSPHFTQCGNFFYTLHILHGNQSSRTSLGSCRLFFETFSIVRFVIGK